MNACVLCCVCVCVCYVVCVRVRACYVMCVLVNMQVSKGLNGGCRSRMRNDRASYRPSVYRMRFVVHCEDAAMLVKHHCIACMRANIIDSEYEWDSTTFRVVNPEAIACTRWLRLCAFFAVLVACVRVHICVGRWCVVSSNVPAC